MSTEERDKAMEKYADWCHERGHSIDRVDFSAGWDARGQVTPDRPTEEEIARVLDPTSWQLADDVRYAQARENVTRKSLGQAAAILALFNEKGTP